MQNLPQTHVSLTKEKTPEDKQDSSSIQAYVAFRVSKTSQSLEKQANRNKRLYFWIHGWVTFMGGLIPLNAAADKIFNLPGDQAHFISAGIAALMGVLLHLEKLIQPQMKWLRFQTGNEQIKKEQWLHECRAGAYQNLGQKEADMMLVEKVEELILSNVDSLHKTNSDKKPSRK